ncbi:MAG: MMPL family transporter [Angelakisella sp.]
MQKIADAILKARGLVVAIFLVAVVICVPMATQVQVNYNMINYLPEDAPSTVALEVMGSAYTTAVPNLRVMVPDVSLTEAVEYKNAIATAPGVQDIMWLDDVLNLKVPLETQDAELIADYYKNGAALFSVTLDAEKQNDALAAIRKIIGEDAAMSGNPVDILGAQQTTNSEVTKAVAVVVPIIIFILLLTTTSWFEFLLFLINVGVAILINTGTNLLFGQISFITQATAALLQLACSMDYSIFLLDRFGELRRAGLAPREAMAQAMVKSVSSITASGLTTVVGFLALVAMRFRIGPDMGYVLAKGIALSLVTTLVFLPCLALFCYRLVERTQHRSFLPPFNKLAALTDRCKGFVTICVALLLIPCFLAQQHLPFMYGTAGMAAPDSRIAADRNTINEKFGQSVPFALLVPTGSLANEQALHDRLAALPPVSSVVSFVGTVGTTIPTEFIPPEMIEQLNSGGYTRMIVNTRLQNESNVTFAFVEQLRSIAQEYYPDRYHLVGESVNIYDMKETIKADTPIVNLIAIGSIALILLFTFRSLTLPLLLLLTIEASIFINIAVPYFMGSTLNYIGYLIISSIQLGATIDYAILFTNRYYENRAVLPKKDTVTKTIKDCAVSILTSAGIMVTAGLALGFVSTNGVVSELGILIARGSGLSALLVLVFLPAMLGWFEPIIRRTTHKATFFQGGDAS